MHVFFPARLVPKPAVFGQVVVVAGMPLSSAVGRGCQDLVQDRADGPLLVVVEGPAAFADQVLPGREVAARPDPVGRGLDRPALGEPARSTRSTATRNASRRSSIRSRRAAPPSSPTIAVASSARATGMSSGT